MPSLVAKKQSGQNLTALTAGAGPALGFTLLSKIDIFNFKTE